MGIHAAGDSAYEWREYGKLMGGYFHSHPFYKITMKLDDPNSPINAVFKGKEYAIEDEIYVFREEPYSRRYPELPEPYSRERLHILLSIDMDRSEFAQPSTKVNGKKLSDKDVLEVTSRDGKVTARLNGSEIDVNSIEVRAGDSGPRKDRDYAVSWIHTVGRGRVFYCSLGHRNETYFNPTIMQHYLAGLQYALGDLEADATPSGKSGGAAGAK
jgi:hypothetical protein